MVLPPLMHGAAQWAVLTAMTTGQTVVFSPITSHLDVDDVVRTIEREKVLAVTVVGDAMARPLADAFERTHAPICRRWRWWPTVAPSSPRPPSSG